MDNWFCNLCNKKVRIDIFDHLRLLHPDIELTFDTWPDGGPIIQEDYDTVADVLEL